MKLATLCYVRDGAGPSGRTLMLHRIKKANDMHAGKWSGLGGKLEAGESPEECAQREVWEESGLHMVDPVLAGVITFPQFSKGEDWYTYIFVAYAFTGELIDSNEGVLAWVDNDKLLDLKLWPGDRVFLRWLDDPRFFSAKFVYTSGELTKYEVVFYTQPSLQADRPDGLRDGRTHTQVTRESMAYLPQVARAETPDTAPSRGDDHADFQAERGTFQPVYRPEDDTYCWMCGAAVEKRHCKIICLSCGFTRDCSDP